jgi:hypothetical protein
MTFTFWFHHDDWQRMFPAALGLTATEKKGLYDSHVQKRSDILAQWHKVFQRKYPEYPPRPRTGRATKEKAPAVHSPELTAWLASCEALKAFEVPSC